MKWHENTKATISRMKRKPLKIRKSLSIIYDTELISEILRKLQKLHIKILISNHEICKKKIEETDLKNSLYTFHYLLSL